MFRGWMRRLFLYLISLEIYVGTRGVPPHTESAEMEHSRHQRLSNFRRGRSYNDVKDSTPSSSTTRFRNCESFRESRDESEYVSFANTLLKEKQFDEASLCYTEAIKKNDSVASYYRRRGYCHSKVSKLDAALLDFRKAAQLDPNNNLGQTFLNETLFDSEKFYELIERIHALNYGNTLLAALADQLYEGEKFEHALRFYTELVLKDPKNASYRHRRGHCYRKARDLDEEKFDFRKSVYLDPSNVEYSFDLSEALPKRKNYHEAEDALNRIDERNLRKPDIARLEKIRQEIKEVEQGGEKTLIERPMCDNNKRKRRLARNNDELKFKTNV